MPPGAHDEDRIFTAPVISLPIVDEAIKELNWVAGRGVIVQTASVSAFDGQARMVPYAAAKGAVVSMILPMARGLAPVSGRVCIIAPGAFATPRTCDPKSMRGARRQRRLPAPDRGTPGNTRCSPWRSSPTPT